MNNSSRTDIDIQKTREIRCINALQEAKSRHHKYLSKNDYEQMNILPCSDTIIKILGGKWTLAKKAAGLPTRPRRGQYDEQDCINSLKEAKKLLGHSPSVRDYDELGLSPSRKVIKRLFGNWNTAIKSAGFEPNKSQHATAVKQYRKEDCIESLKKAKKIVGKSPTCEEYDELGVYPSYDTICRNFESFNDAKKEAGLRCYNEGTKNYQSKSNNYGPNWLQIREYIFDIKGHNCAHCGINRTENFELFGKDMAIHHIIPYQKFECRKIANHHSNLTPLCHSCHARIEPKDLENQCDILNINNPDVEKYIKSSNPNVLVKI